MKAGVLIIGSLLWDDTPHRIAWRSSRLVMDRKMQVTAPIYYGRQSETRDNTFTMTFAVGGQLGQAILVPCRRDSSDINALLDEARALWKAESMNAQPGSIGATWGCVGALFRDSLATSSLASKWTAEFGKRNISPVPPVEETGLLNIPWIKIASNELADIDLILATATRAETSRPTLESVADAWVQQSNGHERYFFNNVRHGIRTPNDLLIWRRIEERKPSWLRDSAYTEAIGILRNDARSQAGVRITEEEQGVPRRPPVSGDQHDVQESISQPGKGRPDYLSDWLDRIKTRAPAHEAAARHFWNFHLSLSITPAVLSGIVGSSLFYGVQDPIVKISLGILSVIAAGLTTWQTVLRPSERSEKHRTTAAQLGALRREIEQVDASSESAMKMLNEHYNKTAQDEPLIPDKVWRNLNLPDGVWKTLSRITLSSR